jgi:hypothetical protein
MVYELILWKCCKFRKANEESVKSGGRRVDTAISGG